MPEFPRLDEVRVVRLPAIRGPAAIEEVAALAGEGRIRDLGGVHRAHPEKALAYEIADLGMGLGVVPRVAVLGEIVDRQGTERADIGERLELGVTKGRMRPVGAGGIAIDFRTGPVGEASGRQLRLRGFSLVVAARAIS